MNITELVKKHGIKLFNAEEIKCHACPECGCKEFVNENLLGHGSRNCRNCTQDWWTDIDYTYDKE